MPIYRTTVRYLRPGDVLHGSGFTVHRAPYGAVRMPKGKLYVEGAYPGRQPARHIWNASTTVHVTRPETGQ